MSFLTNSQRLAILKFQQEQEKKRREKAFFNQEKIKHMRYIAEQERKNKNRRK